MVKSFRKLAIVNVTQRILTSLYCAVVFFSAPLMAPVNLDHSREVLNKRKCVNMMCFVPLNIKYTFLRVVFCLRETLFVSLSLQFLLFWGALERTSINCFLPCFLFPSSQMLGKHHWARCRSQRFHVDTTTNMYLFVCVFVCGLMRGFAESFVLRKKKKWKALYKSSPFKKLI